MPEALAKGDIPKTSSLAQDGYALWLHSTKKDGKTFKAAEIASLALPEQKQVGHSIGHALVQLHNAMSGITELHASHTQPYADIKNVLPDGSLYSAYINLLEQERSRIPPDPLSRPVHKDFNISNLLFSGLEVCAILDFAEQSTHFPEKDICDITKECPSLQDFIISAYEDKTDHSIAPHRITLGLAENALYSAVINARRGASESEKAAQKTLVQHLSKLGYEIK